MFHVGDYVHLQQTAPTTLDVMAGRTILRMQELLTSRVLMLEVVMVLFGRTMCVIVRHVTSQMWMVQLTQVWQYYGPAWGVCFVGLEVEHPIWWCVIDVLGVGTWHAWLHLWMLFSLDDGFVLVVLWRGRWLDLHMAWIANGWLTMRQHSTRPFDLCTCEGV